MWIKIIPISWIKLESILVIINLSPPSLRNGRIILKDDLYDNVMEIIIKGTQGGLLKPTPDTKKPADGHKQSCKK